LTVTWLLPLQVRLCASALLARIPGL
jgi:hypothetical protein